LLDNDARRDATLLAGAHMLRRRRQWRVAQRILALTLVAATATVLWFEKRKPSAPTEMASPTPQPSLAIEVRSLNDDELLALFPDTPVGLATLPDGKKRLIFPRAGDEARFITRM
jgi:hypothetical protein